MSAAEQKQCPDCGQTLNADFRRGNSTHTFFSLIAFFPVILGILDTECESVICDIAVAAVPCHLLP